MQDDSKVVWSIPYVSVAAFFPSLRQNFIAYRSSKVSSRPDCIFEIHQLWQSGFSRVYSNCCCSCSFVYDNFKCLYKKRLETYWMHCVFSLDLTYLSRCSYSFSNFAKSSFVLLNLDHNKFSFGKIQKKTRETTVDFKLIADRPRWCNVWLKTRRICSIDHCSCHRLNNHARKCLFTNGQ